MGIEKPIINPTFFYGPVISYEFNGGITKDKGKYRIRFTLVFKSGDTYKTQKSGFETYTEASKAKDILVADLARNEYIPFDYSVKEFFDYWLYYYMLEEKKVRYNTYQSYHNVLYNYLMPALGESKKLKSVTIEDITNAIRKVPYPSVKSRCAKTSKLIFSYAFEHHYIRFNPAIAALQNVKKEINATQKRDIKPYTIEQIKLMLYMCKENYHDMYIPLLLTVTLGTRISETIALMYSDIDFTSGTIYIVRQLGRIMDNTSSKRLTTTETKTENGVRSVPVPQWVIDELIVRRAWYEKQKQTIPNFEDSNYICCHCDGTPFTRDSFRDDFHQLTAMCGLPRIHWHDLRHTYASVLKNNSVNMKAISEFLGHHSPDFTETVYVHKEEKVRDCSMLTEVWEKLQPENKTENKLTIPFTALDYEYFIS